MSDLMKRYEAQYGPAASGYLYTLGGDPAAIVAEMERNQAAPEADPLAFLAPLIPFPGLPDFRFNAWAFKDAWNEAHPDEARITVNGAALLSI